MFNRFLKSIIINISLIIEQPFLSSLCEVVFNIPEQRHNFYRAAQKCAIPCDSISAYRCEFQWLGFVHKKIQIYFLTDI